jgi:hypothetical protein
MVSKLRFELDIIDIIDRVSGRKIEWLKNKDVISDEFWDELMKEVMFDELNKFIRGVVEKEMERGIGDEENIF